MLSEKQMFPGLTYTSLSLSPPSLPFLDLPTRLIHLPLSLWRADPLPSYCLNVQSTDTHACPTLLFGVCTGRTCTCASHVCTHTHTQTLTHTQTAQWAVLRCPILKVPSVPSPLHAWTHMYRHPLQTLSHSPVPSPERDTEWLTDTQPPTLRCLSSPLTPPSTNIPPLHPVPLHALVSIQHTTHTHTPSVKALTPLPATDTHKDILGLLAPFPAPLNMHTHPHALLTALSGAPCLLHMSRQPPSLVLPSHMLTLT